MCVSVLPLYLNYYMITNKNVMLAKKALSTPPVFRLNPVLFNISYLCFSFKEPIQRQTLAQLWVDLSLDHCSKLCALSLNNSLVMPSVTIMSLARMYARE